jgi:hypothetical protein
MDKKVIEVKGDNNDLSVPDESTVPTSQPPEVAAVDPFDPMNLGISTEYAAAISAHASTKPFELRKPHEQEFFRTSPCKNQRLLVGGILDKQDMSKLYVVLPSLLDEVRMRFLKHIRIHELVLTQTLAGASDSASARACSRDAPGRRRPRTLAK